MTDAIINGWDLGGRRGLGARRDWLVLPE